MGMMDDESLDGYCGAPPNAAHDLLQKRKQNAEAPAPRIRPEGSNADEWHMYLSENKDALGMIAVGIAEAIEAAEARMWTSFVSACEVLEEEADNNLPGAEDQAKGYFRGVRYAAKSVRRTVEHPKYRR